MLKCREVAQNCEYMRFYGPQAAKETTCFKVCSNCFNFVPNFSNVFQLFQLFLFVSIDRDEPPPEGARMTRKT